MSNREFYYRWEWQLQSTPEQLWPLIADTNRFDHDTGFPEYDVPEQSSTLGLSNSRRRLRIRMYGVPLDWVEEPFEWIRPYRFGVTRNYEPGPIPLLQPLKQLRVKAELAATETGGTHLIYEVWAVPRNFLGSLAIPIQIGQIYARRFDETFREYDAMMIGERSFFDVRANPVPLPSGAQRRLDNLRNGLTAETGRPELVDKLIDLIARGDDLTLNQLRPYVLANHWQAKRKDVLELMLLATRRGLLDFQWDLLCPMCRVAKESVSNLEDVNKHVHCDTCNIDYTANFDQSVELTFRPNPAIRPIPKAMSFCTSGPEATPHVAMQQLLPSGGKRLVMPRLEIGRYKMRTNVLPGGQYFQVVPDGGVEETAVCAHNDGWPEGEIAVSTMPMLELENNTDEEQLFALERTAWSDHAVTAAEVTTLQKFRDLFAQEALRPGDQISVGSLTILFTDLIDSTRMYREIGDAPAFGLVMNHFDVLKAAIDAEDGAIVKTIGDAVMAVFRRPVSAVKAVHAAQAQLSQLSSIRPLRLKAAIHFGPSIAVTLNERLDYFGSTINIASRLEKFSQGTDIVMSDAVSMDPEVQDFLEETAATVKID
ncbi:MAG: adenylate/guanylate cyclase domain-containing protein, partial [Anaerolineales bacterium]|nr:adenylate/guanylate cyclase domain-containing protein [Anaerolineales bacterium]